jgi:hypothetical protein
MEFIFFIFFFILFMKQYQGKVFQLFLFNLLISWVRNFIFYCIIYFMRMSFFINLFMNLFWIVLLMDDCCLCWRN